MVEGNLPEGYRWDMLVQHEDNLDIIGLSSVSENCASAVLSSAQLCYEGIYQMQLRGTLLSDLKTKRHTNVIFVHIPRTIIGDGTWNVVPTSFIEIEQNILKANAHPPIPGDQGYWKIWDFKTDSYVESEFPLPEVGYNIMVIDGGSASLDDE